MSFQACGCETSYIAPSIAETCNGNQYVMFMSLVDLMIRYACTIADPCNRVIPKTRPDPVYDFIVVGAGSGGSAVSGRLAEVSQWKTLVIEAGMDEPPATQVPFVHAFINTEIDWNFTTQREANACLSTGGICTWPRGKVLGGCSVFNGMMYMRGTPHDYKRYTDAGLTEWSFDKLLPVFKKSEDNRQIGSLVTSKYHAAGGPFTIQRFNDQPELAWDVLAAAREVGYPISNDLNGDQIKGFAVAQTNNRNGARLSAAKAFIRPHKNSTNLHVMINSTVTRVLVSGSGNNKKATGVEFVYNGKTFVVNASKEIILAAGAVKTPHILLLSGIGDKVELDAAGIKQVHNLTAVGKGIQNHVSFSVVSTFNRTNVIDLNIETLDEYISHERGPLSSTGMSQLTGRLSSNYTTADDPDIQLFFTGMQNTCAYSPGTPGLPVNPQDPNAIRTLAISAVNLHPKSKGYIGLLSKDPFQQPKIVGNYLTHPDDIKVVLAGIRMAQKLVRAPSLKKKYNFTLLELPYGNCSKLFKYDTDKYWECAIKYSTYPENHQVGSCKMGLQSNPEACVNQHLQLYGIPNIRIADASVLITTPSGNTQAPIIAVAERAVLYMREKYLGEKAVP